MNGRAGASNTIGSLGQATLQWGQNEGLGMMVWERDVDCLERKRWSEQPLLVPLA